jgi:hypothetical protein
MREIERLLELLSVVAVVAKLWPEETDTAR